MNGEPLVWIVRHGETGWSRDSRHTSRTDLDLTGPGEQQASTLRPAVTAIEPDTILCSPRLRAQRTAELAGLTPYDVTDDLREWDYGELEGRTTSDIQLDFPGWSIWSGPWPGGETAADVTQRADRVIAAITALGSARVVLVGHGHFSRVLAARWVGEDVRVGQWLDLDTASVSQLGWAHDARVLRRWNVPAVSQSRP